MNTKQIDYQDIYELVDKRTNAILEKVDSRFEGVEERLSRLENWQSNLTGRISVVVAVAFLFFSFVSDWLKTHFKI